MVKRVLRLKGKVYCGNTPDLIAAMHFTLLRQYTLPYCGNTLHPLAAIHFYGLTV